jgi:hypothetical protein
MWEYEKAVKKGNDITVVFKNEDNPEEILHQEITWGYDPNDGMTETEFKEMIKREAKNYLDHLNSQPAEEDLTMDL